MQGSATDGPTTNSAAVAVDEESAEGRSEATPSEEATERPEWRVDDENGDPVFAAALETLPGEDPQGAQTAAVSYLGMYYDGLRTGSSQQLRAFAEEGCAYCAESVLAVDAAGDQGVTLDPSFSWGAGDALVSVPTADRPLHRVLLDVREEAFVLRGPDGEVVREAPAEEGTLDMGLRRTAEGWRVVEVLPLSPEDAAERRATVEQG